MSENVFQKVLGLLGSAWMGDVSCPYQTPVEDIGATPQPAATLRPQALGSPEIYGDVPFVPPEFNR
jgi:hypothetical protein